MPVLANKIDNNNSLLQNYYLNIRASRYFEVAVNGQPIGECLHPGTRARTHGRTTRKHNASVRIY